MGISMQPTLNEGDIILINKTSKVGMGDIIVLPAPDADYLVVKRICSIRHNIGTDMLEYWLLGDNRDYSHDSRDYGWIEEDKIEGKVTKVWKSKQH
jgi:signal peptidase I